jgi:hypothetical protein
MHPDGVADVADEPDEEMLPTALLDVVNTQLNRVLDDLRRVMATGTMVTVDDIAAGILTGRGKRDTLAVMLAVTLQRLAWT